MPLENDARQTWNPLPASWRTAAFERQGTVLLESSLPSNFEHHSFLFTDASQVLTAQHPEGLPSLFVQIEDALKDGKWVAGWISYEAGAHFLSLETRATKAPLAIFGIYESPEVFDHSSKAATTQKAAPAPKPLSIAPMLRIDQPSYTAAIARIQAWIAAGDTYQVNFTTSATTPCTGDTAMLYDALRAQQPCSYGAVLNLQRQQTILSFSPELFFRASPDGTLTARPMKGTATRGASSDPSQEALLAEQLRNDEKNRAEHVMIVDLLRNDLGRICAPGTVNVDRLFDVETYATLLQMTSTITGRLPHALPWYDVFCALFPSGSITGAPKRHTMELISQIEDHPRGIYTGAIGYFAPDRSACFNVAIRTAVIADDNLELGVGGGIVADSTADDEYKEVLLKTSFLQRAAQPFQLIETMRSVHGGIRLLDGHMQRLTASATALGFSCNELQIRNQLESFLQSTPAKTAQRVRLLLHRDGTCTLQHVQAPAWPQQIKILLAEQHLQSTAPHLRHKTTFRPEYDPAFKAAQAAGFDEVIFTNERGEITEGAITSLLVAINGTWFTPPLASGALPGVYRAALLKAGLIAEINITLDELRTADHLCLCNAVRGTGAVASLHLPNGERISYKVASNTPQLPAW